jgi:hypothetical protein
LHYIRYLESKIRVLEYRLKLESLLSDSSDTSEDSSSDTDENTHEQGVDISLDPLRDTPTNSDNRRVIEIQDSTWEDDRRNKISKVKDQAKRRRRN